MRWSSHMAKGCVPAEPIARPRARAVAITWSRRPRNCTPASRVLRAGLVEISSTDSMSSGLISPSGASSRSSSIALTRSSPSRSRIINSSSIPIV